MEKWRFIGLLLFLFLLLSASNTNKAFAAVGDRTTPFSAWENHRFTLQEYSWETPKVVELQLMAMYTGEDANYLVENENMFNDDPAYDEEWILMGFNLKYVSGPEEPLSASDVIWTGSNFYTNYGTKISPIDSATLSNILDGYGQYDVELYPGAQSQVWYGILVKKTVGFPLVRIGTGYNSSTSQTQYSWFSTDSNYYEPVAIQKPSNVVATPNSYNSVKISWAPTSDVSGYEIYRSTSSTGTFTKVGTTSSTSYINTSLNTGTNYYYKVRAYKNGTSINYSDFSTVVSGKPVLSTPSSLTASSMSYNTLKTSWAAVSGASGYEVYRSTSSTGTYSYVGSTTSTSYNNSGLTTNTTYYYKIKAYRMVGTTKVYSNFSAMASAKPTLTTPTSVTASSTSYNTLKTSWAAVSGASGYEVYRSTSSTGTFTFIGSTTSTSYSNAGLTTNTSYYYKIKAYRMVGTTKVYSGYSGVVSAKPIPSVPGNFTSINLNATSIKVTWSPVSGASGYEVYRSTTSAGTFSLLKSTTNLYYTHTGLTTGNLYYYKLRAYRVVGTTKVYSGWTTVITAMP